MLRLTFALLLLLNGLFFAWSSGWLKGLGLPSAQGERSPERMALQQHPERIKTLSPQAAEALQTRQCLQLPPLTGDEALRAAQSMLEMAGLTHTDWQVQSSEGPGVWAVATIRLGTRDFQTRKEETYRKMKIPFEPLKGPPEEMPTLVLSRHGSQTAAQAAMDALNQRALKGLRVIPLQAPQKQHLLQIPKADGLMQAKLQALNQAALGGGFKPCNGSAAGPSQPASAPAKR